MTKVQLLAKVLLAEFNQAKPEEQLAIITGALKDTACDAANITLNMKDADKEVYRELLSEYGLTFNGKSKKFYQNGITGD